MRWMLYIIFSLVIVLPIRSQLLIDVGYSPAYYELNAMEMLKTNFNTSRPWLENELNSFHALHGVHGRIKHRFKNWGPWIEFNYQVNSNSFSGTEPGNTNSTKGKIKSNYVSYLGGLEVEKDWLGCGMGFGQQKMKYIFKKQTGGSKIDDVIFNDDVYILTLFINILPWLSGSNLSNLAIQPYYNLPLDNSNFSSVADYFGSPKTDAEPFWQVGLRLILSNGQR